MEQPPRVRSTAVTAFAVTNFCFAAWMLSLVLLFAGAVIYGVFFSGDPPGDVFAGVAGGLLVILFISTGLVLHLVAGVGLLRLRRWGYYAHLAAAVFQLVFCLSAVYTIVAFVFCLGEEFRRQFS